MPGYALAPKEASDPHRAEVKPTGVLGPSSVNGCTMSPVSRWKRLTSPQGVFHVPKSDCSRSDTAASASNCSEGVVRVSMYS